MENPITVFPGNFSKIDGPSLRGVDRQHRYAVRFWDVDEARRELHVTRHLMPFNYALDFHAVDFRKRPDLYRVGRGEQGVLLVQPYKNEILPHWRFKNRELAQASADKIFELFESYLKADDFVGADMARKFLQMGFTRARRYANHQGGKKYDGPVPAEKKGQSGAHGRKQLPPTSDPDVEKVAAAAIFKLKLAEANADPHYQRLKSEFQAKYGK